MNFLGYTISKKIVDASQVKKSVRPSSDLVKSPIDRIAMQMDKLKSAVDSAIDIYNPDRRDLIGIYENVSKDAHVISQMDIAFNKVISQPFVLSKNGSDNEELTKLLKKEWFEDFQKFCIEPEFWGYTLVEFGLMDEKGEFNECNVFSRRNVLPFSYAICFDAQSPTGAGIRYYEESKNGDYKDITTQLFLIELGKADKLGKFETLAREVIWKNFARTDWSQGSEKFGMPLLDIATDTEDKDELNRLEYMARNFASNGYVIRGVNDQVQILQASGRDFYKIYQENALLCDDQISKCINGSTASSDQQAFVGAAEVHERTTAEFHHSRMRKITNVVNSKLIPFLVYHGYPLDGCEFRYLAFDAKPDPVETTSTEPEPAPDPKSTAKAQASKKVQAVSRPW